MAHDEPKEMKAMANEESIFASIGKWILGFFADMSAVLLGKKIVQKLSASPAGATPDAAAVPEASQNQPGHIVGFFLEKFQRHELQKEVRQALFRFLLIGDRSGFKAIEIPQSDAKFEPLSPSDFASLIEIYMQVIRGEVPGMTEDDFSLNLADTIFKIDKDSSEKLEVYFLPNAEQILRKLNKLASTRDSKKEKFWAYLYMLEKDGFQQKVGSFIQGVTDIVYEAYTKLPAIWRKGLLVPRPEKPERHGPLRIRTALLNLFDTLVLWFVPAGELIGQGKKAYRKAERIARVALAAFIGMPFLFFGCAFGPIVAAVSVACFAALLLLVVFSGFWADRLRWFTLDFRTSGWKRKTKLTAIAFVAAASVSSGLWVLCQSVFLRREYIARPPEEVGFGDGSWMSAVAAVGLPIAVALLIYLWKPVLVAVLARFVPDAKKALKVVNTIIFGVAVVGIIAYVVPLRADPKLAALSFAISFALLVSYGSYHTGGGKILGRVRFGLWAGLVAVVVILSLGGRSSAREQVERVRYWTATTLAKTQEKLAQAARTHAVLGTAPTVLPMPHVPRSANLSRETLVVRLEPGVWSDEIPLGWGADATIDWVTPDGFLDTAYNDGSAYHMKHGIPNDIGFHLGKTPDHKDCELTVRLHSISGGCAFVTKSRTPLFNVPFRNQL